MGAYEKAEMAFSQAIALEGDVPARYIALSRAEEKLGRPKKAIEALESAYELDPKVTTLKQMMTVYEGMDDTEGATAMQARIEEQIAREQEVKRRRASARALKAMRASGGMRRVAASKRTGGRVTKTRAKKSVVRGGTATRRTGANARVIKSHVGRKRI